MLSLVALAGFWLESATAFALIGTALALCARGAGIPQTVFWRSLRPLLLLAAFTMLAGAFLNHPAGSLLHPVFSWSGLHKGALFAARMLLITLLTTLFFLTTRPHEAISLGVRLMAPLRLLGIEAKELSLLVHLAYRFVPLLTAELEEMRWGRLARNLTPPKGPLERVRNALDAMVSVVIGALHRAETTGLALEQRGLIDRWQPARLSGGSLVALWPSLLLATLGIALLHWDASLL